MMRSLEAFPEDVLHRPMMRRKTGPKPNIWKGHDSDQSLVSRRRSKDWSGSSRRKTGVRLNSGKFYMPPLIICMTMWGWGHFGKLVGKGFLKNQTMDHPRTSSKPTWSTSNKRTSVGSLAISLASIGDEGKTLQCSTSRQWESPKAPPTTPLQGGSKVSQWRGSMDLVPSHQNCHQRRRRWWRQQSTS